MPTQTHENIAMQIDHQKPDNLVPGRDVGMSALNATTVLVVVGPYDLAAAIEYDVDGDWYNVTVTTNVSERPTQHIYERVYCDQLGELVFGANAKPWTMPFGAVETYDNEGNVVSREEF